MGKIKKRIRSNARELWEASFGKVPDGHHIKPIFDGGTDDISNLQCCSIEEHQQAHLTRYKELGDFRDLCSYYMLCGCYHEAHKTASSNGGKIGGQIVKSMGIGIFKYDRKGEEFRKIAAKGGSASQATLKRLGVSAFYDKELKKIICSKGGKASPVFKDPKRQSEFGKRGGVKNKGFRWYNDGVNSFKYTPKMQATLSFDDFMSQNNFNRGMLR